MLTSYLCTFSTSLIYLGVKCYFAGQWGTILIESIHHGFQEEAFQKIYFNILQIYMSQKFILNTLKFSFSVNICLKTIYLSSLGFYVAFNTVQLILRRVVQRAEETSTYSWSRFCTINCRLTASNYQLSHLRSGWELNPDLRGGRRECYPSATMAPFEN